MMTEEWRAVVGFPYEVSNIGRVRNSHQPRRSRYVCGRILKPWKDASGYLSVVLHGMCGIRQTRRLHSLVAEAFIGPMPTGRVVNHINADRTDNRVENLEYVTPGENVRHAFKLGRGRVGSRHQNAKLTESDVVQMRALRADGMTLLRLGGMFGVSFSTVGMICRGDTWSHVATPGHAA